MLKTCGKQNFHKSAELKKLYIFARTHSLKKKGTTLFPTWSYITPGASIYILVPSLPPQEKSLGIVLPEPSDTHRECLRSRLAALWEEAQIILNSQFEKKDSPARP